MIIPQKQNEREPKFPETDAIVNLKLPPELVISKANVHST